MPWPLLTLLAVAGLLAVWWLNRTRHRERERRFQRDLDRLEERRKRDLLEAEVRQQGLLNSMVEGVLLLDEQGRIRMANHAIAALLGVSGDLHSLNLLEAFRRHELSELVESLNTASPVATRELQLLHPERVLQVNAAAILTGGGQRQGAILVFHDLTNIRKLERTRQEFVANVSHELRTPLSLIKGYAETLLNGAKDDPAVATKFLQGIDRNAERLRLIMDDLLTISALESGRLVLNLEPVALRALAEKVVSDFQSQAATRDLRLISRVPELTVRADWDRLEQVIANLVDNAVKYGRNGGSVSIDAAPLADGLVEVAVQDDGPGIPPEALNRVFERFYRIDKGRSREQGGTGLGLSIVKHIVQSHGGRAWVESTFGQGATFRFTLQTAS